MIVRRDGLVRKIAEKTGFTMKDTESVIRAFEEVVKESIYDGDEVMLSGVFHIRVHHISDTRRRHPSTGELTVLPAHDIVKIRPLSDLKNQIVNRK